MICLFEQGCRNFPVALFFFKDFRFGEILVLWQVLSLEAGEI